MAGSYSGINSFAYCGRNYLIGYLCLAGTPPPPPAGQGTAGLIDGASCHKPAGAVHFGRNCEFPPKMINVHMPLLTEWA